LDAYGYLVLFYSMSAVTTTLVIILAIEVVSLRRRLKKLSKLADTTHMEVKNIKKRLEVLKKRYDIEAEEIIRLSKKL